MEYTGTTGKEARKVKKEMKIIPCLDIKQGRVVKGIKFVDIKDAGDPVELARKYQEEGGMVLFFWISPPAWKTEPLKWSGCAE